MLTASNDEHTDLFHTAAGSCGTLGVITLLEIQLIEAQPFVELTYHPASSPSEALKLIQAEMRNPLNIYIDGIIFSPTSTLIMSGRLTSTPSPNTATRTFTRARDPWFYLHAQHLLDGMDHPIKESIPLRDYLFRYDRGAFWTGRFSFLYFMMPFNRITRFLLDHFMHTRVIYHAVHESGFGDQGLAQDTSVPFAVAEEYISYVQKTLGFYPLWLCPLRANKAGERRRRQFAIGKHVGPDEMMLNVGVWGMSRWDRREFIEQNRQLESKVRSFGGLKVLYAHTFYTEDEFWDIYDSKTYETVREKYHAEYLPTVFDKVKGDLTVKAMASMSWFEWIYLYFWSVWPLAGLYGVWRVLVGKEYLLRSGKRS